MNPQAEAGAHYRSARTAVLGVRFAAIIMVALSLLTGCMVSGSGSGSPAVTPSPGNGGPAASTFCGGGPAAPSVSFHPDLLPFEISLDTDGNMEVSFDSDLIVTPVGTFSVNAPLACSKIASTGGMLLVISRVVHDVTGLLAHPGRDGGDAELLRYNVGAGEATAGSARDVQAVTLIKINYSAGMTFAVDGPATLTENDNIAQLSLGSGVTGIRIAKSQGSQTSLFSLSQVSAPLPTPSGMAPPSAPPASGYPVPKVSCQPDGNSGNAICSATPIRGPGSYQWFDNGISIGSVNRDFLNAPVADGDYITATLTISNGNFDIAYTSNAVKFQTQGGSANSNDNGSGAASSNDNGSGATSPNDNGSGATSPNDSGS